MSHSINNTGFPRVKQNASIFNTVTVIRVENCQKSHMSSQRSPNFGKGLYTLFGDECSSFSLQDLRRFSSASTVTSFEPCNESPRKTSFITKSDPVCDFEVKKFFREALFDPVVLRNDKTKLLEAVKVLGCIGSRPSGFSKPSCTRSIVKR